MPTKTVTVPVAEIVEGGTKTEFYADLRQSLDLARKAANKAVTLCLAADSELMIGGKCPKLYTYPDVAGEFPGVASLCSSITRAVERKYRQERWHVASGRKSVCHYRSMPWPLLSNKSVTTVKIEQVDGACIARMKLLRQWWSVRLAGGSRHARQIAGLKNAIRVGDSKVWIDRKHRAILGLSVEVASTEPRVANGTLNVSTSRECLLVATKQQSDTPFVITGDEVRQWVARRNRMYQRLRQDRKSGAKRSAVATKLKQCGDKWKRRMDSYLHQVSAQVVEHAKRRRVAELTLDATIKSFVPQFPYFELAVRIKYKCELAGIGFKEITQSVSAPDVTRPHVYFKLSPSTGRVKIGQTARTDGGRHGAETDAPEDLVILAVDNQPKSKLIAREKHYHAMFASSRVNRESGSKSEWFEGEYVIQWLRDVQWLGNAGNLSQILQVLPLHDDATCDPPPGSSVGMPDGNDPQECSQEAVNRRGYADGNRPALAMAD